MNLRLGILLWAVFVSGLMAQRPLISIAEPTHGQTFASGFITLSAHASDADGYVARVDYYINGLLSEWSDTAPFIVKIFCTPGRYTVRAIAYDNVGYYAESTPIAFQVGGDFPVSLLRGPYLQSCSSTSIVVRWRTDWLTNSIVRLGTNTPGEFSVTNHTRTSEHAVHVTGLTPDTLYTYSFGSGSQEFDRGHRQTFRTAPTNARPVTVWAIGDFGTRDIFQEAVRDAFLDSDAAAETDLWLMLGDNAYEDGTDEQYQGAVFEMYDMLLPNIPVWPTIGNHDVSLPNGNGNIAYFDIFDLPMKGEAGGVPSGSEHYYSFNYANIHFICLDSEVSDRSPTAPMLQWLREDLADTDKDWIVAFWHHPPYSAGTHFSDTELRMVEMRQFVGPILEAHGVDLVLTGHSHVYERSYLINGHYGKTNSFLESMKLDAGLGRDDDGGPYRKPAGGLGADQGTVYVVCGCSGQGGEGYPFYYGQQPCMVRNLGGFGSLLLEFNGLRLDVKFLRPDGSFGDYFAMDKSQPTAVRPELTLQRSGASVALAWPTSNPVYSLESAFNLLSAEWQMVTNPLTRVGRQNKVVISPTDPHQFFRLRTDR